MKAGVPAAAKDGVGIFHGRPLQYGVFYSFSEKNTYS
jgi:hypothetical protein